MQSAPTPWAPTTLIVLGGFAGTGKTALSRRLSSELGIPRLGSDDVGQTINASKGIKDGAVDSYWIAYDVLFGLCEGFLQSGVSAILDLNMGWAFQWQHLDSIRKRFQYIRLVPIILRCSREICIARVRARYSGDPTYYSPPDLYLTEQKHLKIWEFLDRLDRSDIHFVDASGSQDDVYEEIKQRLMRSPEEIKQRLMRSPREHEG